MTHINLKITAIPAFSDNYIWAIDNKQQAVLVDPGDADVCIEFLKQHSLELSAILVTHHHADHTGGIANLLNWCKRPIPVYGANNTKSVLVNTHVNDKQTITVLNTLQFQVIAVPGHTLDHLAYYHPQALFCGDTLFSAGCGRLFEGSAEQMFHALEKLAHLPDETPVYCAHEYTSANIQFARSILPNSSILMAFERDVLNKRKQNIATIPSTIATEKQVNLFLQCADEQLKSKLREYDSTLTTPLQVFTKLRQLKDNF